MIVSCVSSFFETPPSRPTDPYTFWIFSSFVMRTQNYLKRSCGMAPTSRVPNSHTSPLILPRRRKMLFPNRLAHHPMRRRKSCQPCSKPTRKCSTTGLAPLINDMSATKYETSDFLTYCPKYGRIPSILPFFERAQIGRNHWVYCGFSGVPRVGHRYATHIGNDHH